MIKRSLKNYFVCLKYILIPFGTLFLGLIIGLSIFIPVAGAALHTLIDETKNLFDEVSVEPRALVNQVVETVLALDWSNPAQAVLKIISPEWIESTLQSGLVELFGGEQTLSEYTAQISLTVDAASVSVQRGFSSLLIFAFLGVITGYFLLRLQIRKQIAARAFWKSFLAAIIEFLIVTALTVLSVWLATVWKFSIIFTFIVAVLTVGGVAIAEAYLIHGYGKIKFREVFTLKNVLLLVLSNLIIFLIWAAVTAIISYGINAIAGIIIGLVLLELTSIVLSLNAEAYVKYYCETHS
ncbi:MAG: hypothetical protein K2O89_07700 [Clostridia bacterium]|nr:hypothetical protein [Clostridia bacterium]